MLIFFNNRKKLLYLVESDVLSYLIVGDNLSQLMCPKVEVQIYDRLGRHITALDLHTGSWDGTKMVINVRKAHTSGIMFIYQQVSHKHKTRLLVLLHC